MPSPEQVTTCDGMTPCIAGLISSGRIRIRSPSGHLRSGAGAGGLEEDLLDTERDRHARSAREAEKQALGHFLRKPIGELGAEPGAVRFLKGDLLVVRGPRREVDALQLVGLVTQHPGGEGNPPIVLEVAQNSLRSPFVY